MWSRRRVLQILVTTGLTTLSPPLLGQANHKTARIIGCCRTQTGFGYAALDLNGKRQYWHPLPQRGHGMVTHDELGVLIGRAPGQYLQWFNPKTGEPTQPTFAPKNHYFQGHGAFWRGLWWFTSEGPTGALLLAYSARSKQPILQVALPGTGAHELIVGADDALYIAIGGWQREQGQIINAEQFDSTLLRLEHPERPVQVVWHSPHAYSIRHLASSQTGLFVALQHPKRLRSDHPLVYCYSWSQKTMTALPSHAEQWQRCQGYIGSIAASEHGIIASSPVGHTLLYWPQQTQPPTLISQADVAAVCASDEGFISGSGFGQLWGSEIDFSLAEYHKLRWDNHWHFWRA